MDSGQQQKRRNQLIAIGGFAVILVAALIAISLAGGDDDADPASSASSATELFAGLEQEGKAVGDPDAPLTLIEFGDPQCPFCAQFAETSVPPLVEDYVRSGDVRMVFEPLTFLGPDSDRAARFAFGVAEQGAYWSFIEALYAQQGAENSGWVTEDLLLQLADDVGVDGQEALDLATTPEAVDFVTEATAFAEELGVNSTPTVALAETGSEADAEILDVDPLDPDAIGEAIDARLGEAS